MPPKNDEIKQKKYHLDFEENLESYTKLVLETLNDKNFKNYIEFSYLISKPEFDLLPEAIKKKFCSIARNILKNLDMIK